MAKITITARYGNGNVLRLINTFVKLKDGKVGFFDGKAYGNGLTVAENAAIQHFGTRYIPARPFMDVAAKNFKNKKSQIAKIYANALLNMTAELANKRIGALYEQEMRKAIRDGSYAALDPKTIKAKGSSKPLVDTALLIQSVEFRGK